MLSRSEFHSSGGVFGKVVEETYIRVSPVLHLLVGGHVVKVTTEHPFFAEGRGWVAAGLLEIGDRLHTMEGAFQRVEAKSGLLEVLTVYNFRVAEYHTYFVGDASRDYPLWTHNTHNQPGGAPGTPVTPPTPVTPVSGMGNIGSHGPVNPTTALSGGQRWLGSGYQEIAPGVYRSAGGLRQFRMTTRDLLPTHGNIGPHVHFEALNSVGQVIENLHLPIIP